MDKKDDPRSQKTIARRQAQVLNVMKEREDKRKEQGARRKLMKETRKLLRSNVAASRNRGIENHS